jgi:hypothetical protein
MFNNFVILHGMVSRVLFTIVAFCAHSIRNLTFYDIFQVANDLIYKLNMQILFRLWTCLSFSIRRSLDTSSGIFETLNRQAFLSLMFLKN